VKELLSCILKLIFDKGLVRTDLMSQSGGKKTPSKRSSGQLMSVYACRENLSSSVD